MQEIKKKRSKGDVRYAVKVIGSSRITRYSMSRQIRISCRTYGIVLERLLQQEITQYFVTVLGQLVLLLLAAVILEAEDHRILGRYEGRVSNRVYDILEYDVSAHGFAVSDYWLLVFPLAIPAIQLNASLNNFFIKHRNQITFMTVVAIVIHRILSSNDLLHIINHYIIIIRSPRRGYN